MLNDPADYKYRKSLYIDEIKSVIICDGITSVADGSFAGSNVDDDIFGNPFRSVTNFIVKGNSLTLAPDSNCMSGIECDITYKRT